MASRRDRMRTGLRIGAARLARATVGRRDRRLLEASGLLDPVWYLARYPDVMASGFDPVAHYMEVGAAEGRDPGPAIGTAAYLLRYPDVRARGINPLVHFLRHGRREGRSISPAPATGLTPEQPNTAPMEAAQAARIRALEARTSRLEGRLRREADRLDQAFAAIEGVTAEIDPYHAARRSQEYLAAFHDPSPLVTVCIATVGVTRPLVERAIASVRAQTYRNLQVVVVVGDHVQDDTAQRVADLGDDRLEFHDLPERGPYPPPGGERWNRQAPRP